MMKQVFQMLLAMAVGVLLAIPVAKLTGRTVIGLGATAVAPNPTRAVAPSPALDPAPDEPRHPQRPPRPGEVREMTIKRLGNFSYAREHGIPPDVRQLDGMQVRLRGYMVLLSQSDRITRFALVPTLGSCCYGQPPALEHIVMVACPEGKAAKYTQDEIIVQGTLHVREQRDDGQLVSLYEVAAKSVKPMAG